MVDSVNNSASLDVSGVKNLKLKCNSCDKNYASEGGLKRHTLSKHQMVRFHCEQCYLSFSRADYLRGHIRALHEGEFIKCNQCDYKTTTKTNLKAHLRSKHGAEKLPCDMCDFQSASTCGIIGQKNESTRTRNTTAINVITQILIDHS